MESLGRARTPDWPTRSATSPEAAYDRGGIELFESTVMRDLMPDHEVALLEADETIPPRPEEEVADAARAVE